MQTLVDRLRNASGYASERGYGNDRILSEAADRIEALEKALVTTTDALEAFFGDRFLHGVGDLDDAVAMQAIRDDANDLWAAWRKCLAVTAKGGTERG